MQNLSSQLQTKKNYQPHANAVLKLCKLYIFTTKHNFINKYTLNSDYAFKETIPAV